MPNDPEENALIRMTELDEELNLPDCTAEEAAEIIQEIRPVLTPTEDQSTALDLMADHIQPPFTSASWAFLLEGYAGTGKTLCITLLAKNYGIKPSQICFTAPTNKAVKVLRSYLDQEGLEDSPSKTIYSLLGLSLQANGEVKELTKPEEPVDLSSFKVIIVDEASMVNRFLMDAIEEASLDWKVPFIFMGDPAQLPPIGELRSPVFKIQNRFALTKVLRYGNSMLDLATRIRQVVDHPFPTIKIQTDAPVYRLGKADWLNAIEANLDLFKSGDAKVIAWRNVTVDKHNAYIRGMIFGKLEAREPWLPGDQIVAREPCKGLEGETLLHNGEEARVLEVALGMHPYHSEYEVFNLLCEHESGRKITIRALTPAASFALSNRLNELSMEAKGGKRYKWKEFWELKEAFNQIRHSYAITSHGSQGSSYIKVWVDLEDIMLNRNRAEAFRSLYVSCTRQREELNVS